MNNCIVYLVDYFVICGVGRNCMSFVQQFFVCTKSLISFVVFVT